MKKTISIFLALLLIFLLAACGKRETTWQEQYDLGLKYITESDYPQALTALSKAIELDPQQTDAYFQLIGVYLSSGKVENAEAIRAEGYTTTKNIALNQGFLAMDTDTLSVWAAAMARRYQEADRPEESVVFVQAIRNLTPDYPGLEELAALSGAAAGQENDAAQEGEAAQEEPAPPAAVDLEAVWADFVAKQSEEAVTLVIDDYDNDGREEAFGVIGQKPDPDNEEYVSEAKIYYVNASGRISLVRSQIGDNPLFGYVRELLPAGEQKFFAWEASGGGSASITYLIGVKNGIAYEPVVSGVYMNFHLDEAGQYSGTVSDFSKGYHDYIDYSMTFNEEDGDFDRTDGTPRPEYRWAVDPPEVIPVPVSEQDGLVGTWICQTMCNKQIYTNTLELRADGTVNLDSTATDIMHIYSCDGTYRQTSDHELVIHWDNHPDDEFDPITDLDIDCTYQIERNGSVLTLISAPEATKMTIDGDYVKVE